MQRAKRDWDSRANGNPETSSQASTSGSGSPPVDWKSNRPQRASSGRSERSDQPGSRHVSPPNFPLGLYAYGLRLYNKRKQGLLIKFARAEQRSRIEHFSLALSTVRVAIIVPHLAFMGASVEPLCAGLHCRHRVHLEEGRVPGTSGIAATEAGARLTRRRDGAGMAPVA